MIADTLRFQLAEGERPLDPAALREGLDDLDANAERMAGQIDELLDVARLQTGQPLKLRRRPTDLLALARAAIADQQRRTRRHQIRLETSLFELAGTWDAPRLERVLGNLLANAVKYSPRGGEVAVRVDQDGEGDAAVAILRVVDRGVGIPAAELPRVFSWYFRGSNVAEQVAGAGIGLAGARQIVEQHGGTIGVASQEGVGSTFTVRLPLAPPPTPLPPEG
jgi:signal transduction histidine kinase